MSFNRFEPSKLWIQSVRLKCFLHTIALVAILVPNLGLDMEVMPFVHQHQLDVIIVIMTSSSLGVVDPVCEVEMFPSHFCSCSNPGLNLRLRHESHVFLSSTSTWHHLHHHRHHDVIIIAKGYFPLFRSSLVPYRLLSCELEITDWSSLPQISSDSCEWQGIPYSLQPTVYSLQPTAYGLQHTVSYEFGFYCDYLLCLEAQHSTLNFQTWLYSGYMFSYDAFYLVAIYFGL